MTHLRSHREFRLLLTRFISLREDTRLCYSDILGFAFDPHTCEVRDAGLIRAPHGPQPGFLSPRS